MYKLLVTVIVIVKMELRDFPHCCRSCEISFIAAINDRADDKGKSIEDLVSSLCRFQVDTQIAVQRGHVELIV